MYPEHRNKSLRNVGVQTSPLRVFNDRALFNDCDNFYIQPRKVVPTIKNVIAIQDVEDFILDNIVSRGQAVYGYNVLNAWLKPWENGKGGFSFVNGELHCLISKFYSVIWQKCETDASLSYHMNCLHNAVIEVTRNSRYYFNQLGKLRCKDPLSIAQIFALFISWASKFLHCMIAGYVCDFLTLLFLRINNRYDTEEINAYFIEKYLKSKSFPEVNDTVQLYKQWADWTIFFYIEPIELVSLLTDYFKAVNYDRSSLLDI